LKVLLINPPLSAYKNSEIIAASIRFEPLGLLYLAAYLREAGVNVKIFDAYREPAIANAQGFSYQTMKNRKISKFPEDENGYVWAGKSDEEIKREIAVFKPGLVGISSMFTVHQLGAHYVAKLVKDVSKDILVIMGGAHASCMPEYVLRDKNVDIVVKGEGEVTLFDIVKRLERKEDIYSSNGIVYRNNGKIVYQKNL